MRTRRQDHVYEPDEFICVRPEGPEGSPRLGQYRSRRLQGRAFATGRLGRLWLSVGDPLFVRRGQRLVPTDFARSVAEPLSVLLTDLEGLLNARETFDRATEAASLTLSGSDYLAELLMPELARRLSGQAVTVLQIEPAPKDCLAPVRSGRADRTLVPGFALDGTLEERLAFVSAFAVIARRGHPTLAGLAPDGLVPLDTFCALAQVVFSVEGKHATMSAAALAKMGRSRHLAMTAADFSGVYRSVAASDMISVIPAELALSVAGRASLDFFRPPMPIGPVPIHMA